MMAEATASAQKWLDENGVVGVCDFCARPTRERPQGNAVTFVLTGKFATRMEMLTQHLGVGVGEIEYSEDWIACPKCAAVIEEGDPVKLTDHVVAYHDKVRVGPGYPGDRDDYLSLYRMFFARDPKVCTCGVTKMPHYENVRALYGPRTHSPDCEVGKRDRAKGEKPNG